MSYQNTLANFKLTTIELIEEFILEKIKNIASDTLETETIVENDFLRKSPSLLESFFQVPDEFWNMSYEWFQHIKSRDWKARELHDFLLYEIRPSMDLFQGVQSDKLLILAEKKPKSRKTKSSKNKQNNRSQENDFDDTILFIDSTEYMQSLIDSLHEVCALKVATELIQSMNLDNLSLSTLQNLLEGTSKLAPNTEEALSEITGFPTPVPLRAGVESHYRRDKWKKDTNNYAVFESTSKSNPRNRVEVYIGGEKDGDILAWEAALQVIDLMGIDAAKLQLVFASYAFNSSLNNQTQFTLKGTEIIKQIGWDKKHRLTVPEKLAKLASITFHLGRMLMECTWVEGKPKGDKVDVSVSISPLWVIEVDARGQKNIFTGKVDNPEEVYINVSPGPWAEKWLNRMGMKAGIALHQFGWLATEILKIDPYHDELALKLAIHLTMISRIKLQNKNQYEHKVGSLLEAVELEARIDKARQDFRESYNLKQRWDSALALLMSMNWQVIFDDTSYPKWLRPNSKTKKPSNWRKEKIIDRLWKARLTIMPPDPIPALLSRRTEPLKLSPVSRTTTKSAPLTVPQVRTAREVKGWSQRELATCLGVSQKLVSMIERGDRTITPKLEAKLRKVLEIPD